MKLFGKSKDKVLNIYFSPELSIHHIENQNNSHDVFRVNTRDHYKQTKNIKVPSSVTDRMQLELSGFDKVEDGFIKGEVYIRNNESNQGRVLLCENCIRVNQDSDPKELKTIINEIWADEFTKALDDYQESLGLRTSNQGKVKKQGKRIKSTENSKDFWINIICGVTLLSCILFFGWNYLGKYMQNNVQKEQTILQDMSTAGSEQTNNVTNSANNDQTISADDEAMQEFGLEKGISLDVNEN